MRKRNHRHRSPSAEAHAAGKAAAQAGDIAEALSKYKIALDAGAIIRMDVLQDVLSLGKEGRRELESRRDALESAIERDGSDSVRDWQTLNAALAEPERDLRVASAVIQKGIKPHDVALFESVIYRLMSKKDVPRALEYARPLAEFLHEKIQTPSTIETWERRYKVGLVRTAVGCVVVAVQSGCADLASMLMHDILAFHPHAFTYCALRELGAERPFTGFSVVTDLSESGKQYVSSLLEKERQHLPARALAEIAITDRLAKIDPEKLVAAGAPLDEYSSEARKMALALNKSTTIDQLAELLIERFVGPNTYGSAAEAAIWATNIYSDIEAFLPEL